MVAIEELSDTGAYACLVLKFKSKFMYNNVYLCT